jgi:hypothetical protein
MKHSISIVEYKVEQARFFLESISEAGLNFFAVQCFADAFTSASRSITFSMQSVLSDLSGFKEWYATRSELLNRDSLCRFFNAYRRASIHIGETVARGGRVFINRDGKRVTKFYFAPIPGLEDVPIGDVFSVCSAHFTKLLEIVFEVFLEFRQELDDRWYYTEPNFRRVGKTFADAVAELGFPREYVPEVPGYSEAQEWRALRLTQTVGCTLNATFLYYLGKNIEGPDDVHDPPES